MANSLNHGLHGADWRPTPKFLLRRDAVRMVIDAWMPGRFLEVGAGTGTITRTFLERGYSGICYDLSDRTRDVLQHNLSAYGEAIETVPDLRQLSDKSFDYLFAFEVLEHIQDDQTALRTWTRKLKPGGRLLISVPAHQCKYSDEDRYVGHVRRYEKTQLAELLDVSGFVDAAILNYGFPLGNLTGAISRMLRLSGSSRNQMTFEERSIRSGIERSKAASLSGFLYNDVTLYPFFLIQRLFFTRDLGDGYLATAIKRSDA